MMTTNEAPVEKLAEVLWGLRERDPWERVGIIQEVTFGELKAGRVANPDPDYPHLYDDLIRDARAVLAALPALGYEMRDDTLEEALNAVITVWAYTKEPDEAVDPYIAAIRALKRGA